MKNLLVYAMTLATLFGLLVPMGEAQDLSDAEGSESGDGYTVTLAFSKDGRTLHEIRMITGGQFRSVRAITRDVSTGKKRNVLDLEPDTEFLSATTDGRIAVIVKNRDRSDEGVRLFLLDTETGRSQDIPSNWFDPQDRLPEADISGDGRLVSILSIIDSQDAPRVVSVYNWRTKRLVSRQATGFSAGGFDGGGVTVDGKIEFSNNRSGTEIVDPRTGQSIAKAGPNSYGSPNGAWIVDFPNPLYDAPQEVIIQNGHIGQVAGKLDLQVTGKENWAWRAAFCGTSSKVVAATYDTVQVFELPSGAKIADFPLGTWKDTNAMKTDPTVTIACNSNGRRVAIRSGVRLTLHKLK